MPQQRSENSSRVSPLTASPLLPLLWTKRECSERNARRCCRTRSSVGGQAVSAGELSCCAAAGSQPKPPISGESEHESERGSSSIYEVKGEVFFFASAQRARPRRALHDGVARRRVCNTKSSWQSSGTPSCRFCGRVTSTEPFDTSAVAIRPLTAADGGETAIESAMNAPELTAHENRVLGLLASMA